jgi:AraC-like DNA-binding protein
MVPDRTVTPVVLGQAAVVYRERAPLDTLRRHFARTWCNVIPSGLPRTAAIVPDGYADLQWIDGTLRIAGPDSETQIEPLAAGTTVVGLRFQPGAAAAWLGVPASELVNERLPLEAFWGHEARHMADWVSEARSPEGIARRVETAIERKAATMAPANGVSRAMFHLIGSARPPGGDVVRRLSDGLELSERTLRRHCHEAFGYGPKTLDRILRFQRFLHLARVSRNAGLAGLAADAGYADQAHLTRETRRLAGLTPRTIVTQLGG